MIYFAYGANMNPAQMGERSPGHRTIGVARLPSHRLHFPSFSPNWGCASASIAPSERDTVFGVLYDVPLDDVAVLHHQAGYDPQGRPALNRHNVREVTVLRMGGSAPTKAITYVAVPDRTTALPSEAYMNALIDGARYHGLPRAYIVLLKSVKTAA